ncbi:arginine--tRNA ligase [Candidatus Trichorickettsia mobilis]|uniref:arginine--tRNA ligase n=1 Tax=Candidatus Trichorickettsia mobilis TaxID=1346319 RepID=UPI00293151C0|nr:arginine--tRNA ligase [Candidatus Trichorickettsia mobilis]
MNIFNQLKQDIIQAGQKISTDHTLLALTNIEIPKDHLNGDLSTNIAMIIAAKEGINPREVAIKFKELMSNIPYIAHLEIAGPGFINFTIKADRWHNCIQQILSDDEEFISIKISEGEKVNIEFVSANPTGPLHIGHARGAVYGDALACLLDKCGYKVTKEYYVNDAGSQIDILIQTAILRYKQALTGEEILIPAGLYPGEYLIPVGIKLAEEFGDKLLTLADSECNNIVKQFVVTAMLAIIANDLHALKVEHDIFFSEQSLHDHDLISTTVNSLRKTGLVYEGVIPPPKGKIDPNWQERTQLLFKSTMFGDDQDRPLQKSDGSWSYFAADLAYAQDKIRRGFTNLIYILGADHSGYVARIKATIQAVGEGKIKHDIKICQLVNFVENNVPIKMSKRKGSFTTVKDVIEEVDVDIIRFIMLTRKNDAILDFDLAKVKEQSKENPVFYVQYAHVRIVSILANGAEHTPQAYEKFINKQFDLSLLASEEEIGLIKLLASWPKILEGAAKHFEPHRIAFYLLNVAARFHALWNLGKENNDYRFVLEGDIELTATRLALVKAIQKIIVNGLEIIGIQPMDKM